MSPGVSTSPQDLRRQPDATEPPRVVIVYDDFAAGARAVRLLTRMKNEAGAEAALSPVPWSFDYLAELPWRSLALRDIDAADLLILSISQFEEIPHAINCWITTCLHRSRVQSIPVLAMFDDDDVWPLLLETTTAVAPGPPEPVSLTSSHSASRPPKFSSFSFISPSLHTAAVN